MIGIERLYKLIVDIDVSADPELWYILRGGTEGDWDCEKHDDKTLGSTLAAIADQIKREQGGRVSRMRVLAVVTDMERHVSGVEGIEDSPVVRWARELRAALGGNGRDPAADVSVSAYDLLPQEDRDAIAWVREHGGLDAVERRWECLSYYADPVPRSCMEKRLARLQRQIDECHEALRRRNQRIAVLASEINRAHSENRMEFLRRAGNYTAFADEVCKRLAPRLRYVEGCTKDVMDAALGALDRRLVPEGCEWPRYESGELVNLGDRYECWCGETHAVSSVTIRDGRSVLNESHPHTFVVSDGPFTAHGKRVRRPAPKVLDADGVPIREGETVWHVESGERCKVVEVDSRSVSVDFRVDGDGTKHTGSILPANLTHRAPVLDADGVEIREGDRVWSTQLDEPHEWIVINPHEDRDDSQTVLVSIGDRIGHARPEDLTHRAPVLAADGLPLREGETVWMTDGSERHVVLSTEVDGIGSIVTEVQAPGAVKVHISPSRLTHERPDSWERIEEDAGCTATKYNERRGTIFTTKQQVARDLVRRCRALAERERGE